MHPWSTPVYANRSAGLSGSSKPCHNSWPRWRRRTKAARLLVYEAAAAYDAGERVTKAAAIAKLYATETAQTVVDMAIQIHGAQALERGHLLEHLYRDVRATRIYEGTSEIQREIIARELYR